MNGGGGRTFGQSSVIGFVVRFNGVLDKRRDLFLVIFRRNVGGCHPLNIRPERLVCDCMGKSDFTVKRSPIHGRGLFARTHLAARRKLGELCGDDISLREARRRAIGSSCIAIVEFGDGRAIDAARGSNHFKYVNHSCQPNCFMRISGRRVEFYARRDISAGEELTCRYGETHHGGTLPCRCQSVGCQGFI